MLKKVGDFIGDRLPLFVGIGIIIASHWTWMKLQEVPTLVSEEERKEMPLLVAARAVKRKVLEPFKGTDNKVDDEKVT